MTGILLPPTHALVILNMGIGNIPKSFRMVVTHILIAARFMIAKQWKAQYAPNPLEVITLIKLHHSYEHTLPYGIVG